jgi:hypothetical protein
VFPSNEFALSGAGEEDVDLAILALNRIVETVEIIQVGGVALHPGDVLPMSFTASSSLSLQRPVMKTYAPFSTKSLAVSSAMPEVATVMTATFPSSFPMTVLLSYVVGCGEGPLARRYRQRAVWTM